MEVMFNETLKTRTIAFCEDELNYHIIESGYADEYHDENCAEIEILFRLGEKSKAKQFAGDYLAALNKSIANERDGECKTHLRALKKNLQELWKTFADKDKGEKS